jgi:hypothetical protein
MQTADTTPILLLSKPAIIRPSEPWERRLHAELAAKRIPIGTALAITAEVKRLQDGAGLVRPHALADISKWSKFNVAMLPGLAPWVSSVAAPVLTYIGSASSSGNNTTYNFGNFTAPTAGLMIVAAVGDSGSSRTVSSISIGGSNGTLHVNPSLETCPGIASRVVSAGVQSVSATFSGGVSRAACFVWLLTGYSSATPTATASGGSNSSATSATVTLSSILARGVAIYVAAAPASISWGTATRRDNLNMESGVFASGADKTAASNLTSDSEVASWSTSGNAGAAGASWR